MTRPSPLLAAAILTALVLAACGDDPAPDPADIAGINACKLVTKEEAEEALGRPVGDPRESLFGDRFHECLYRTEGDEEFDSTVTVQARINSTREEYDLLLSGNCPQVGGAIPIEDLGEAAHKCVPTFVFADGVILAVTVIDNEDPENGIAWQTDLARVAVDRLPEPESG